jgi:hypothetical protein
MAPKSRVRPFTVPEAAVALEAIQDFLTYLYEECTNSEERPDSQETRFKLAALNAVRRKLEARLAELGEHNEVERLEIQRLVALAQSPVRGEPEDKKLMDVVRESTGIEFGDRGGRSP